MAEFKSDIEIAQECTMRPITEIAAKAGIDDKYLEQYGSYKAKIDPALIKETDKKYYRHTGYLGHLKVETFNSLLEKNPVLVLEKAVKGMLQHNTLGAEQFNKLKVYCGSEHPHAAQKPVVLPKEAK